MNKIFLILLFFMMSLYAKNPISHLQYEGSINYEIEKPLKDNENGNDEAFHDIDIDFKLSYPLAKNFKFIAKIENANDDDSNETKIDLEMDQLYLSYEKKDINIQAGLQQITGPFFYEKNGDGILLLNPLNKNILALSFYMNNTFSKNDEVYQLAIIGETQKIGYSFWYAKLNNSNNSSTGVSSTDANYGADVLSGSVYKTLKFGKLGFKYSTLKSSSTTSRDLRGEQRQTVIYLKNEEKIPNFEFAYIMTGKNGGNVALDESTKSEINYSLDEVGANDNINSNIFYLMYKKNLTTKEDITFEYLSGDGSKSSEEVKLSFKSYIGTKGYYYISTNYWKKYSHNSNQKVEIGFNISF